MKKASQVVVRSVWVLVCLLLALACAAAAQAPRTEAQPKSAPGQLAPATSPTSEEAAEAVKAPAGVPAMPTAAPVDPKAYKIGAEDILLIRVWRENELSGQVQVRPDGKITLNLIGEVQAAGLTPIELTEKVTQAYSDLINKPEVMVSVQSVQSRRYFITGEVNRPGSFQLVTPIRVLEALTNAGGFREFASTKKIRILRNGKTIKFNYNEVSEGKRMEQNIEVEPGDYIIVP
ncbi:MAG TPA: polysaccharide biosynthesis/export family protein [Bryobacteraceae bacterium]|nr:polysaccharide biosynthesis/export family protein [Bryobacteraceae bacterium]